jgi:asparagine synthase (glutamine-hydrolysing)
MSGVAALFSFDGAPVDRSQLDSMLASMANRGGAREAIAERELGLGCAQPITTPDAAHERQPAWCKQLGVAVAADVRLDNRSDLIQALGIDGAERALGGDAELILRSYARWGSACVDRLLGDFAFVVVDFRRKQVLCARDHLGVKPLWYHHAPGRRLVVASTPEGVLASRAVARRLDEGRVADVVLDLEGIDLTCGFFAGVVRLAPAHTLLARSDGIHLSRYWRLEPGEPDQFDSEEECGEAFLEVLDKAVACRLQGGAAGVMLSGGIDSAAIAAIGAKQTADAGRGQVPTFSAVNADNPECLESAAVRLTTAIPGQDAHLLSPQSWSRFHRELEHLCWGLDDPFDGHMTLPRAVSLDARAHGVSTLLTGLDGDLVLGDGGWLTHLIRTGRLATAGREAVAQGRWWGSPYTGPRLFGSALRQAIAPRATKLLARRWLARQRLRHSFLRRDFAAASGASERIARYQWNSTLELPRTPADSRAQAIRHPHLAAALERYDRVASSAGVEPRHPYLDIRVVQFALAAPVEYLAKHGRSKLVLRRATAGLVPDPIRWRQGKEHLGAYFTDELLIRGGGAARALDRHGDRLAPYVDLAAVRDASPADLLGMVQLALWLENHV